MAKTKSRLPDRTTTASPDKLLPDMEDHVEIFRNARNARRTELVEDYIELIADLIMHTGEARKVDIATRLGVAHPTVSKMINRLEESGLVTQLPYRGVFLTEEGRRLAVSCHNRHNIVQSFLEALGVSAETARQDAEGMEHHVSSETLEIFERFSKRSKKSD